VPQDGEKSRPYPSPRGREGPTCFFASPSNTCMHKLLWDCGILGFVTMGTPMWPVGTALMFCAHNLSAILASQWGDGP